MAMKRKTTRKTAKATKTQGKRAGLRKQGNAPKKVAKKKSSAKGVTKRKTVRKKTTKKNTARSLKKKTQMRERSRRMVVYPPGSTGLSSGEESGDLQGLSNVEDADSESVDELLEEGNAFEAGVISGVEEAGDRDEQEVHTHEVPEDDVPEEYLDKD
jgi:hypothetical protein